MLLQSVCVDFCGSCWMIGLLIAAISLGGVCVCVCLYWSGWLNVSLSWQWRFVLFEEDIELCNFFLGVGSFLCANCEVVY